MNATAALDPNSEVGRTVAADLTTALASVMLRLRAESRTSGRTTPTRTRRHSRTLAA